MQGKTQNRKQNPAGRKKTRKKENKETREGKVSGNIYLYSFRENNSQANKV